MHKRLSILIPTLLNRRNLFQNLSSMLDKQRTNEVEILSCCDNGEMTIGKKRNLLLSNAEGEYVSFIDDDDLVSDDYIKKVLDASASGPDCCSLQGEISMTVNKRTRQRKRATRIFKHSIDYTHWYQEKEVYYRCPNHLNAIRRSIALKVKFPNKDKGEDRDFSLKIQPLLRTESKIEGTIYFYFAS